MTEQAVATTDGRPPVSMPYPGIFRVTVPTPFPGLPTVHVYLTRGRDGLVMIDTSLGMDDSFERIEHAVRWLGHRLTDLEAIVLTHAHPDHFGLAGAFQEASGAPVICHPIAEQMLRRMSGAHGASWGRGLPQHFQHIDEEDTIGLCGGEFSVYWTPGHEWGHVVFFRHDDALLLSGDTILGKITPHVGYSGEPPDPLGMFLDSLDKVAALEPAFVLPGHGRSFPDGRQRAVAIRAHHELRLRRILTALRSDGPLTAHQVASYIFRRELLHSSEHLAVSETMAHLEYLRLQSRIERDDADGEWTYGLGQPW